MLSAMLLGGTFNSGLSGWKFLSKSMSGEEVACELINVLLVTLGVQSHLLAAMRDRASVNNVVM